MCAEPARGPAASSFWAAFAEATGKFSACVRPWPAVAAWVHLWVTSPLQPYRRHRPPPVPSSLLLCGVYVRGLGAQHRGPYCPNPPSALVCHSGELHGHAGVSFGSTLLLAWECRSLKSSGTRSWPCTGPGHGGLRGPEPPVSATGCWVRPAPLLLPGEEQTAGCPEASPQVAGSNRVSATIRHLINLF